MYAASAIVFLFQGKGLFASSILQPAEDDLSGYLMRKEMADRKVLNIGEQGSLSMPDVKRHLGSDVQALYAAKEHRQHVQTKTLDWLSGLVKESPITQAFYEWADSVAPDTSDTSDWPSLANPDTSETWDIGLNNPVAFVISLADSRERRAIFAARWKNLSLSLKDVYWLPAINGSAVPTNLRNPNGALAKGAEMVFKDDAGIFGCFASHLMAYRRYLKEYSRRDLIIFEDDAEFHPDFKQLWKEFSAGLPDKVWVKDDLGGSKLVPWARLHFGGDGFWSAPVVSAPTYYQATWVSRTWAYAIKAEALKGLLERMESRDEPGNMGIDQQLSGSTSPYFPVLTPKKPLVLSCTPSTYKGSSLVVDADQLENGNNVTDLHAIPRDDWNRACWGLCYLEGQPCADSYDASPGYWPHNASLLTTA